jgi:3-oxoacyl-[acyl-carrier protein] reductase
MNTYNFKNKTILITAGSKGIGFELAKQFHSSSANVIILSRNNENLNNAVKKILDLNKESEGSIMSMKFDIGNIDQIENLFKTINEKFPKGIDILINNSGGPPFKKIMDISKSDWDNAITNNLSSAVFFSKNAINMMIEKKWGRIINLTSATAKEPVENFLLSNAPRAALSSFAKTLSMEVGKYGITVNTILTGGVLTGRLESLVKDKLKNTNIAYKDELKKISSTIPVGHIASTEEFVQIALFLASENSSYITGSSISVDGGASKSIF